MSKISKYIVFISLLFLIFITGCETKKDDSHYKPSEFKHDVAINNADSAIESVNLDLMRINGKTPIDVVVNTYRDGITKMKGHLTTLENTKKLLNEDKDLSNSERKLWSDSYDSTIRSVKNKIKEIEQKQEDLMK